MEMITFLTGNVNRPTAIKETKKKERGCILLIVNRKQGKYRKNSSIFYCRNHDIPFFHRLFKSSEKYASDDEAENEDDLI